MSHFMEVMTAAVLGSILLALVGTAFLNGRLHKLNKARAGESLEKFMACFAGEGIHDALLRQVYRRMQRQTGIQDFKVMPSDDLHRIYGLAEEDLEETVLDLAKECGCKTPTTENVAHLPLNTVEDLVHLLWKLHSQSIQPVPA